MLSFFRKYEKTFFLIVFLPAIIGMGVTSVIVTVLTQKSDSSPGKVFDEPITQSDWQAVIGPYNKIMGRQEDGQDSHFRFYAYCKAAEQAGVRVSDAEVADKTIELVGREIARRRAAERIRDSGIDPSTDEGRRKFTTYFFEEISGMRKNFTDRDYATYLSAVGMTMGEFEGHQRRALMMEKLEQLYRDAATVSPEELWKEFREKGQKREAEVVTIEGAAYVPSAATVPTDQEVKAYYETHKSLYDEPRRVALEYVAAPFEKTKAEVGAPSDAQLQDYYDKHKAEFTAFVGTQAITSPLADVRDKVVEKVQTTQAKDRAQVLLEKVAAKLDEQRKAGKIDLAAAVAGIDTKTTALVTGVTPLLEQEEFFSHPLLGGFSTHFWASKEPVSATKTSDPLKGEKAVSILRTSEIKEKKVPTFAEVQEQAKKDYVLGGERELKKYYQEQQWKYRTKDKWKFEAVFFDYDEYAKKDPNIEITADEVNAFWRDNHARVWPGQADAAKVGSDAITLAAKAEKAKPRVQKHVEELRKKCVDDYGARKRADLGLNKSSASGFLDYQTLSLDREEITKDPRLSVVATAIPLARKEEPSEVFERADKKGKFFFVVQEKVEQKVPELVEIKDTVAKDVLAARGFERAKLAAEKLVQEMRDLKGDQIPAALKQHGLTSVKTGVFARTATVIPNVPSEGAQIVGETFACEANGGFEKTVSDDLAKKVYLVRCAQREDPADSSMSASDRQQVRRELLKSKRQSYVTEKM
ncbi:MAG: hypothetical protein ACAI25_02150, partial [Planctomycetota bacterium]